MDHKGVNKKRKRTYNVSGFESDVLQLENVELAKNEVTIVSDDKVSNSINKFTNKPDNNNEDKFIKFIVCSSEAEYFRSNRLQILEKLKIDFELQDISISSSILGTIDRFVTLFGSKTAIAKSITYCSFILAKINNFSGDLLTLKSSSYSLTLLLNSNCNYDIGGLRKCEIIKNYQYNQQLASVYIFGDFTNIYNFVSHTIDLGGCKYINDDTRIYQQELFGTHLASNILDRSNEKNQQLINSKNQALEFITRYSIKN